MKHILAEKQTLLSLVIPCYNEEQVLHLFYKEVCRVLAEMACGYELIFVDDGSQDDTLSVIKNLPMATKMSAISRFRATSAKKLQCWLDYARQLVILCA